MMLIRFSLLSSNPITLLDTVHPLSDTKPKIGKSRKIENPDLGRSAPPHGGGGSVDVGFQGLGQHGRAHRGGAGA